MKHVAKSVAKMAARRVLMVTTAILLLSTYRSFSNDSNSLSSIYPVVRNKGASVVGPKQVIYGINNGNIFSRQYSSCRLPGRSRIAKFCFTKLGYLSYCIQLSNSVVMLSCGDLELNPGPRESNESRKTEGKSSRITAFRSIRNNLKIAHLNTRSIKCRDHFILVKDTVLSNKFDVFTISEFWLDNTVSDLEIS